MKKWSEAISSSRKVGILTWSQVASWFDQVHQVDKSNPLWNISFHHTGHSQRDLSTHMVLGLPSRGPGYCFTTHWIGAASMLSQAEAVMQASDWPWKKVTGWERLVHETHFQNLTTMTVHFYCIYQNSLCHCWTTASAEPLKLHSHGGRRHHAAKIRLIEIFLSNIVPVEVKCRKWPCFPSKRGFCSGSVLSLSEEGISCLRSC